ncbi:hypothetical protein scyTo_0026346, partial [Scyliorhinus torazame]|nr:hypothetical protein [Scyliorhinus torazame]
EAPAEGIISAGLHERVNDDPDGDLAAGHWSIGTRARNLGNRAGDIGHSHPDEHPHVWPCLIHRDLPDLEVPTSDIRGSMTCDPTWPSQGGHP